MGEFDVLISRLLEQKEVAMKSLGELQSGKRVIAIDGKDVTEHWIVIYDRIVRHTTALIKQYEARNT